MARGARRSPRELEARTGSGTPREEGAIWRMTRCGRRSPSDDAQVVRVARERDDIDTNIGWPVCRPDGCRGRLCERRACPDRIRRSHLHARSKTYVSEQQIVYPPPRDARNGVHWAQPRRASDGFDRNASGPKRVRHASFIATNPLTAENRKGDGTKSSDAGQVRIGRKAVRARAGGRDETPKRDRPEAGRPG
jgi:hypothetical protein